MTDRIREFLRQRQDDGPCLVVDLDVVQQSPVYVMIIEAVLPAGVSEQDVDAWMTPLRAQLQVDISVRTIPQVEL